MVRYLLILLLFPAPVLIAAERYDGDDTEIWLVTYGPGEIYWQRFGHNAIWVRDRELGLDHLFNFGFFDFGQEDFFLRFLQGKMLYFSAARPSEEELAAYIDENRSIRAQKLDLSQEQKLGLIEFLLEEVKPENRDYLYDYYLNNCSTRVRDALDLALGGALRTEFQAMPAEQSWRDHTRRLTSDDFWLYLGLEIPLGTKVDGPSSRWDEMFIPAELAEAVAGARFTGSAVPSPLVLEDVTLFDSTLDVPPDRPRQRWPVYLFVSLAVVLVGSLFCRLVPVGVCIELSKFWLIFSGLAGLALLFFWFGTDHSVAGNNFNLLVFCPLWIPLAIWKGREKLAAYVVTGVSVLALAMMLLPPQQYNLDVLAAFLPLNIAAALGLAGTFPNRNGRSSGTGGDQLPSSASNSA